MFENNITDLQTNNPTEEAGACRRRGPLCFAFRICGPWQLGDPEVT